MATTYSVSRLVAAEPATSSQAQPPPSATPARISPSLPMKPDSGGIPARFIAGTKNSTASIGAALARPPSRVSSVVPPRRSMSPATRNRVVWTVMWWATYTMAPPYASRVARPIPKTM